MSPLLSWVNVMFARVFWFWRVALPTNRDH